MKLVIVGGAMALALAAAGCRGSPSGASARTLSPTERQLLASTLLNSPQIGIYGPVAAQALAYVNEVGQVTILTDTASGIYSAVGLWMDINAVHGTGTVVTQFFTALAWQGTTSSITKLTLVIGAGNSAPKSDSLLPTFNGTSGGTALFGSPPYGANDVYVSNMGIFSVASLSFSGSTDFTAGMMSGSYTAGTLGGNFTFQGVNASKAAKQQSADFAAGLPAVRLIVRGGF
jgi:hypothetical protein